MTTKAYAALSATSPLVPFSIDRRELLPKDVAIEILYCGVCHSDLHQARNEWRGTTYPCVPGHEIVGRVTKVGSQVGKFREGDYAAVGCMVNACRSCGNCREGLEQYCTNFPEWTYNAQDRHGGITFGGYSQRIVVDEAFTLRLPSGDNLAAIAPLLCAGITTYSPLRHWKVGKGMRVGIIGLGGLGHMGVKLASAFGAEVALFTRSPGKVEDARRLGAHEVILSTDADAMTRQAGRFDFLLDTVSADHDINAYLSLLKRDGTLCLVGAPENPAPISAFQVILQRRRFAGSGIGGIAETQEMLDYCAERNIVSDIELIAMADINTAYERLLKGDVRYRFVIDMQTLKG